ncbi:glycoside hydrolase family 20 protein [Streptomyces sp. NPDC002574]|uniref:beta-N-acetylhexosaminidase n=1 Tax=Streptomyces sp. NPDC002574 TaxID=3364652 RepID=UPI00367BEA72
MWRIRAKCAAVCVVTAAVAATSFVGPALAMDPDPAVSATTGGRAGAPYPPARSASATPAGASAFPSIPAVRSFVPAATAGFVPRAGFRVVATSGGRPADEARLLAGELRLPYATGESGPGDITLSLSLERSSSDPGSYEMTSTPDRVIVRARTDAGAFYGTRTILQALRSTGRVPAGTVEDRPDRPRRGLMVDLGRKYFSRGWLEDRVRELGDLKYNELHLHLSDDQGFRVESRTHPELVPRRHLTKADVRAVVALAARRHVSVVPEIDSPGHLGAVLAAHPGLQLRDRRGVPVRGALDISRPGAARLVDDLVREFAPLFPGRSWHLGGDEYGALVVRDPQRSFPGLAAYARERYGPRATVADAATGWLNDRAATLRSLGKRAEAWNDGFPAGGDGPHAGRVVAPDADRVVAYWSSNKRRGPLPEHYLSRGRQLVNLNSRYLYYVLGGPAAFPYPTGQRIYERWTPAVVYRDHAVPAALSGPDRVVGARLAVWCDRAGAESQARVAAGIRMPLRALAQKLWIRAGRIGAGGNSRLWPHGWTDPAATVPGEAAEVRLPPQERLRPLLSCSASCGPKVSHPSGRPALRSDPHCFRELSDP